MQYSEESAGEQERPRILTRIKRAAAAGLGLGPATVMERRVVNTNANANAIEDDGPKMFLFIIALTCFVVGVISHKTGVNDEAVQSLSYRAGNVSRAL